MGEQFYVYAIVAAKMRLPEGVSGFGGPLLILPYGELGAVASQMRPAEMEKITSAVRTEDLFRHEAVVEAICASGPALPVRFGTVLQDEDAVRRALATRYAALCSDLQRIGDKIELGVTALWHSAARPSPALAPEEGASQDSDTATIVESRRPGAAYMRARQTELREEQSRRERAQALGRELDVALGRFAIERRRTLCPSERLALRDRYLLERECLSAFEAALAETRQCHQEVRLLMSGPWPPYSFITSPGREPMETLLGREQAAGPT